MTERERFLRVFNLEKPGDRLPMIEWVAWWDKTMERRKGEGLPADHQTPPGVSLENSRICVRLRKEYAERAAH